MIGKQHVVLVGPTIMMVLDLFFGEKEYYSDLIDLFYGTSPKTEIGQLLDLITAPEDTVTDDAVNFEKYCLIVRCQTAYYSLYLPVALAMYMAGHATPENLKQIKDALIPLEAYSKIQDDYLHCWGKPEYIGNPIIGNPAVCGENYGQKGAGAEQDVNELYKAHFLMAHYKAYDPKCPKYLHGLVANVDEGVDVKREVLSSFIKTIAGNTQ
jgi:farnesyl diphosphate synthase